MCTYNPRNCALRDNHQGRCLTALTLDKLVKTGFEKIMRDLEADSHHE